MKISPFFVFERKTFLVEVAVIFKVPISFFWEDKMLSKGFFQVDREVLSLFGWLQTLPLSIKRDICHLISTLNKNSIDLSMEFFCI